MLQSMRHLAQSWLFKGLMIILMISFGAWGIGDMFRGNALGRSVAKVGKDSITVQQLDREFQQTLIRARSSLGPDLTARQAQALGLLNSALNGLTERAQIDQDITKLGIDVSDKAVAAELMAQPQFKNKDGSFNKDLFRQLLGQAHLSEQEFMAQQRQNIARHQLLDIFTADTPLPQIILDTVYRARGQQMVFDLITLRNDSIKDIATPDDQTLHQFYDSHPKNFTASEYRAITVGELSSDMVAKDIAITDAQVRQEYAAKGDELARPEHRDVEQVVVQSEDKAKQLATAAKLSGNLIETAKAQGLEAILLKETDQTSLLPELAQPVFALPLRQVSDPVKSSLGWHVLQVTRILPAGKPDFDTVKDDLRDAMRRDQTGDKIAKLVNQLDDDLAAGRSLDDIGDGMKLRLVKIPALDARGKTPDGKDPAELPFKTNVLNAAFAQGSGETSPVMDDKQGNYFVVRTDEVTPSTVTPFDQVKVKVLTAWQDDARAARAKDAADKIVTALRVGKPASDFTNQAGVTVSQSKPVSLLGETDPALPMIDMQDILKLKKGEVASFPLADKQLIVRLAQLTDAAPNDTGKSRVASDLAKHLPQEHAEEYLKYLNVLFPITIHQDAVDAVGQRGL